MRSLLVGALGASCLASIHPIPATAEDAGPGDVSAEIAARLARDPLTIIDLLDLADLASPEIAEAERRSDAAREAASQSRAFPNPTLELGVENVPEDDPSLANGERSVGLVVPLPPVSRGGNVAAAEARRRARAHEEAAVRRAIHRRVRAAASEAVRLRAALAASDTLIAQAARLEEIARLRAEARAEPRTHFLKAAIDLARWHGERLDLEADLTAVGARLSAMLGGLAVPVGRIVSDPDADPAAPLAPLPREDTVRIRDAHPDVLAARAELEAAQGAARAAGRAWIPSPELRVAWGRDAAEDGFVEAGASLELPLFDRRGAEAGEARAQAGGAEAALRRLEAGVEAEITTAHARLSAARARLHAHRETIEPAAADALSLAFEGYRAGRLDFLDLLDSLRTLAEAHRTSRELAAAHDDAHAAWLALTEGDRP